MLDCSTPHLILVTDHKNLMFKAPDDQADQLRAMMMTMMAIVLMIR